MPGGCRALLSGFRDDRIKQRRQIETSYYAPHLSNNSEEKMREKNRYFAPQPETQHFTVSVDGKKLPGILPYKGESRLALDEWRDLKGVDVLPATAQDYIDNNTCTVLCRRITKCFKKHWELAKSNKDELHRHRN